MYVMMVQKLPNAMREWPKIFIMLREAVNLLEFLANTPLRMVL